MKCQKCGADLVSGHLYCDICGAEFQIVPDFEPEIENSIAESLSDIVDTIDENNADKEKKNISKVNTKKVPSFTVIFVLVLVCSIFVYLGYSKVVNSSLYQDKKATEAIEKQDYYQATQIYRNIRKHNKDDAYWYVKEAEMLVLMQQEEQAYQLVMNAIDLKKNNQYAYLFLLNYLQEKEDYIEMKHLLDQCPFNDICLEYKEYKCLLPTISFNSGTYEEAIEITFEKGYEGSVYYTLNGDIPTVNSQKYEMPIKLGNGNHILKVIYENSFGIVSETAIFEYQIISETPMSPVVNVQSGKYQDAQMIVVEVEEGTRVFYTTDLSHPTAESMEYTAPIPMPLGESRFNFCAISDNGVESDITYRNFMLNMKTNLSIEDAEVKLVQKLISAGHIIDQNGAVSGRYGVFRYFYKFPIAESDVNFYVFEEHYMENQINNPLGHFYAVDVLYGNVYKLISDGNGNYTRIEF